MFAENIFHNKIVRIDYWNWTFSGWKEAEVCGTQGAAPGHPRDAAEEEAQARSQEEEGREEQVCAQIHQSYLTNESRLAAAEYAKILAQRQKEAKEAKELKRRRYVEQNNC